MLFHSQIPRLFDEAVAEYCDSLAENEGDLEHVKRLIDALETLQKNTGSFLEKCIVQATTLASTPAVPDGPAGRAPLVFILLQVREETQQESSVLC